MTRPNDRSTAAAARTIALAEFSAFEAEHAPIFARRAALKMAVDAASWPPDGHEECSGEDAAGECSAIFVSGDMPDGWVERQFSCGGGGSGTFFCPTHAEQGGESAGRCHICSN